MLLRSPPYGTDEEVFVSEMQSPATIDGLLDQAAVVLGRLEWSQREWALDGSGRPASPGDVGVVAVDVLGAIFVAAREREAPPEVIGGAVDALRGYLGELDLVSWNERPDGGRDRGNVAQKLRAAARRHREGVYHVAASPPVSIEDIPTVAPRAPSGQKRKRQYTEESKLRARRGALVGVKVRLSAGKRPDRDKLAEIDARIGGIDQELHERFGVPLPDVADNLAGVGGGRQAISASGL